METPENHERLVDIHKAALIIIKDRKLLLSRSHGKDIFVAPGGKLEPAEDSLSAAVREINEEQGLKIAGDDLELFGTFFDVAAGSEDDPSWLQMDVYMLRENVGKPVAQGEIAENLWYETSMTDVKQGSIFEHHVVPKLKRQDLID